MYGNTAQLVAPAIEGYTKYLPESVWQHLIKDGKVITDPKSVK
ncbi:MAG: hypothetical protein Nk1A_7720 [Endomicrobiia bacterium]|nr:MAG: hypothetical protein Nk1A_7720 [Endomicrobiia bacterium]